MTYRTANLQSCILYIYSTNIGTEYFKHGIYSPFFPLQTAVCFIILKYLVPVLFTFYIKSVLKLKKNNSGSKRLNISSNVLCWRKIYCKFAINKVNSNVFQDLPCNFCVGITNANIIEKYLFKYERLPRCNRSYGDSLKASITIFKFKEISGITYVSDLV